MTSSLPAWQEPNKHLAQILDYIGDPIFVKNRNHQWVFLNKACCGFMGDTKENLLNKNDYDFFPKHQADIFWEKDELVFTTKQENINEEEFTDAHHMTHIIRTKKILYTSADNEDFIVGIIQDITMFKRMETALNERIAGLKSFQKLAVEREMKIMELLSRIKTLEDELNKKP